MIVNTNLSANQLELIQVAPESSILISGAAGTGKTTVLLGRAHHLVSKLNQKVVILTATKSLEQFLHEVIQSQGLYSRDLSVFSIFKYIYRALFKSHMRVQIIDRGKLGQLVIELLHLKCDLIRPLPENETLLSTIQQAYIGKTQDLEKLIGQDQETVNEILNALSRIGYADWEFGVYVGLWVLRDDETLKDTHLMIDAAEDFRLDWIKGFQKLPYRSLTVTINPNQSVVYQDAAGDIESLSSSFSLVSDLAVSYLPKLPLTKVFTIPNTSTVLPLFVQKEIQALSTMVDRRTSIGVVEVPSTKFFHKTSNLRAKLDQWIDKNIDISDQTSLDVNFYLSRELKGIELDVVFIILGDPAQYESSKDELTSNVQFLFTRVGRKGMVYLGIPEDYKIFWEDLLSPLFNGELNYED